MHLLIAIRVDINSGLAGTCFQLRICYGYSRRSNCRSNNASFAFETIWVGVMFLALVIYVVYGKRHYTPPVVFVNGKREGGVELQGVD
jgi:hypothetical protein